MSRVCAPLRALTEAENEWHEEAIHESAFQAVKNAIVDATNLKFFNPEAHAVVQCDASSQGLGAVIMQNDQPVAFASRTPVASGVKLLPDRKGASGSGFFVAQI